MANKTRCVRLYTSTQVVYWYKKWNEFYGDHERSSANLRIQLSHANDMNIFSNSEPEGGSSKTTVSVHTKEAARRRKKRVLANRFGVEGAIAKHNTSPAWLSKRLNLFNLPA